MAETAAQDLATINNANSTDSRLARIQDLWTKFSGNLFPAAVTVIALLFVVLFIIGIWQSQRVITPLANSEYARGLITFLVAIVTVAIALIMTLYAVLSTASDEQEKRFNHAKEVLTILIGVLGTVIGFYFGSATDSRTGTLNTGGTAISDTQPSNGETVTVTGLVTGGLPPYIYSVTFSPDDVIGNVVTGTSTNGVIQQSIPISTSIESPTDVTLQMSIWDSSGQMATVGSTKLLVSP